MEKNKMPGFLDLISNSLKLYRKNANDFVLLGMIAFIFLIIPDLFSFVPNSFLLFIVMSILGLFFLLVSRISAIVNSAIIVQAVDDVNSGKKIHLDNLYRGAFKRFWSILFVILITGLVFIASVSLFFIPIIAVSVYLAFVMYTLILEDKRGYDALVASFNYIRGNWWAVFGRVILLSVISLSFMAFVFFAYIGIYTMMTGGTDFIYLLRDGQNEYVFSIVYSIIVKMIVSCLITPVTTLYTYQIYKYLKNNSTVNSEEEKKTVRYWFIGLSIAGIIIPIVLGIFVFLLTLFTQSKTRQDYILESKSGHMRVMDKGQYRNGAYMMDNGKMYINSQNKTVK
jgi:hypothetical protein